MPMDWWNIAKMLILPKEFYRIEAILIKNTKDIAHITSKSNPKI